MLIRSIRVAEAAIKYEHEHEYQAQAKPEQTVAVEWRNRACSDAKSTPAAHGCQCRRAPRIDFG
jgi:hypothetical protein